MKLYSVYDNKSKSYGPIFGVAHDAVAIREFGSALSQERSPLAKYPDDYELHLLGQMVDEFPADGVSTPIVATVPVCVITARAWVDAQPGAGIQKLSIAKEA